MPCSLQLDQTCDWANPARYGGYSSSSAGIFGAIDASGIASHLQCLVAQVRPWVACGRGANCRSCLRWQVVLTVQLVFQVKIAPFIDDRLDVVSCMCAASVDGPGGACKFRCNQVEALLTTGLLLLSFFGMVRKADPLCAAVRRAERCECRPSSLAPPSLLLSQRELCHTL